MQKNQIPHCAFQVLDVALPSQHQDQRTAVEKRHSQLRLSMYTDLRVGQHCRTSAVLSPTHGQGKYICTVSSCRSKGHADSSLGSPCLPGVTLEGTSVQRDEQITFQRVKLPQKSPHSEPRGPLYLVCLVKSQSDVLENILHSTHV